jgi:glycosyltransferase involved in cell wall biosynthesis
MTVGWDARVLVNGQRRGIGTYAYHVLQALRECRPDIALTLFHDQGAGHGPVPGVDARAIGPKRGYRWQLWERLGLPLYAYARGCDVVHSPANTTPPRCPVPRVVTLHDAMPFHAWNESANPLPYFRDTQRRALTRADAIITDSEYSKDDIVHTLKVDPARVRVIPLAPSSDLHQPDATTVAFHLTDLDVRSPFVVALAATALRKNTIGVLRAFAALQHEHRDVSLVLTGVGTQLRPTIAQAIADLSIDERRIRCLDFVRQDQLAALYAGSAAFWFLSLYEGFGLPILDAMRCGAVVVCSTRTSCPEVAGNAAIMVDPENLDQIADATLGVLAMDAMTRHAWQARGARQAAGFTWQRTAAMTADVYTSVA